ncbi:MAG: TIGR03905 family TSCPD domain-containing protein [Deltaproteobacteria bacterium]|jgi:uncharacterized protein (TIGR03905 family)|nr:TIGR03905 family TSCPD domain-containing protein [Deltaproteobacteria bacterium]
MDFSYEIKKICPKSLSFKIEDGILKDVSFAGGCPGNLLGISRLVEGQDALKVANTLLGIPCGQKPNSCPDTLARSIFKALGKKARKPRPKKALKSTPTA